jgi:metallophosphoesterase superfamily enzyme
VIQGKKTEAEVLGEFLETFEDHHVIMTGGTHDQVVTKEEWNEYYTNVSSSIDRDDYFELMMNNAWKLNGVPKSYGTGWAS